jgi:hypothetical protein
LYESENPEVYLTHFLGLLSFCGVIDLHSLSLIKSLHFKGRLSPIDHRPHASKEQEKRRVAYNRRREFKSRAWGIEVHWVIFKPELK